RPRPLAQLRSAASGDLLARKRSHARATAMKSSAEFDVIVYGATGYTGRLVAEHLVQVYGVGRDVKWAMAGRDAKKLAAVRDEIGAPAATPLLAADSDDATALRAMCERARCIVTTVGPYQLYGSKLVAVCAATGTDYLN